VATPGAEMDGACGVEHGLRAGAGLAGGAVSVSQECAAEDLRAGGAPDAATVGEGHALTGRPQATQPVQPYGQGRPPWCAAAC